MSTSLTMTIAEAQAELRISRSRLYELVRCGKLPSVKIGRSRRILRSGLEAFLDQLIQEQRVQPDSY